MEQEPRHFWRRLAAFVIDYLAATFIALTVYIPLTLILPNTFTLTSIIVQAKSCSEMNPSNQFMEALPGSFLLSVGHMQYTECTFYPFFTSKIEGTRIGTITKFSQQNKFGSFTTESIKQISIPVDKQGNPTNSSDYLSSITLLLLLLVSIYLLKTNNNATIGKEVMGLTLHSTEERSLTAYLKREIYKLAFLILPTFVILLSTILPSEITMLFLDEFFSENITIKVVSAIFPLLMFFWYILPLIRWKGQMPYDRLTGFKVVRD